MRHFVCVTLSLLAIGCHKDATCPAGMVVDTTLGYCVTPDAGADGGTLDGGASDAGSCVYFRDGDGDMFGDDSMSMTNCAPPTGWVRASGDCNDTDSAIHPGVTETCNGADDDCNGTADDGFLCPRGATTGCTTACGSTGTTLCGPTCEPMPTCTPPAETCNYVDDDCDGLTDEDLLDPGVGVELDGPSSEVDAVAVPGGFVIAVVRSAAIPNTIDLIRLNEDGAVTHTRMSAAEAGRVSLAVRSEELAAVWTASEGAIVGQRFATSDLTPIGASVPISSGVAGLVSDLQASSSAYALTTAGTAGDAIWKLGPDLTRAAGPVSIEPLATVAIHPAPGSPWVLAYSGIRAGSTNREVFARTANATSLALGPEVRVTTTPDGARSPVVRYGDDGSRLAVLYGAFRGTGVVEPEIALLEPTTLAGGTTIALPRASARSFAGWASEDLTWSGGRWWIARVVNEYTPMFVARLRVVEVSGDGTVLGAGAVGRSPDCAPPETDCEPPNARDSAAIASRSGRVLVATSDASGPARAWVYRCR